MEVVSHISIAKEEGFINEADYQQLDKEAQAISRMMSALKKSLQ